MVLPAYHISIHAVSLVRKEFSKYEILQKRIPAKWQGIFLLLCLTIITLTVDEKV